VGAGSERYAGAYELAAQDDKLFTRPLYYFFGGNMGRKKKDFEPYIESPFFLNKNGVVEFNPKCLKCQKECKQSFRAFLDSCKKFKALG
jgi:hypothetical protein